MEKLYSPATVRKLSEQYKFRLSKSLGQNFLTDGNIVDRIIEGAEISGEDLVIEVGPGIGVLTHAAALRAASVVGIELDRNLIPILRETLAEHENVTIRNEDFMKTDLSCIIEEEKLRLPGVIKKVKLIANLPYYITTPIIMKILEEKAEGPPLFESLTVMMQKEVADRIKARPGTKEYGALTVAVNYYCSVDQIASVPKEVFVPKPKVDSTVLRLFVRTEPPVKVKSEEALFAVVKAGFGQRRKTLGNSLTGTLGISKEQSLAALATAGIDPIRRAETLDILEFGKLADEVFVVAAGQ